MQGAQGASSSRGRDPRGPVTGEEGEMEVEMQPDRKSVV